MKCQEIEGLLPDYLHGKLNSDWAIKVEEHVSQCSECREEVEIWKKLALLPEEQPGEQSRARFRSMLESYQEGRWENASLARERTKFRGVGDLLDWVRTPSLSVAWACLLAIAAFLGGRYVAGGDRVDREGQELAALRRELQTTQQLVALSYLQQQSASERLQGVNMSTRLEPDPQVLDALQHTLRYDTSVDVRLAALDALSHYGTRPEVSRGLMEALDSEQSPMVQVALIDVLVDLHDSNAVEPLKRLQQAPKTDPTVRKHVDWGIRQLGS